MSVDLGVLKEIVLARGVSGWEDEIRNLIVSKIGDLGSVSVDEHGNVILDLTGDNGRPTLMIAAHMDELGLLTTIVYEDGLVGFRKIGGIDDRILPSRHVEILGEKGPVPGVIGFVSPHLDLEKDKNTVTPWHKLRIDVGAENRGEALEMGVRPGQPVAFKKHFTLLAGGKMVASRGLDDRAGVYVVLELAKRLAGGNLPYHVVLAWTVREEIGLWGAFALAAKYRPSAVVAVDTIACCRPEITGEMKPGSGPVLRIMDNLYIASRIVADAILAAAEKSGVGIQIATGGGSTDASAFQRLGVASAAIGIPLKYTHTLVETVHLNDISDAVSLLEELVRGGHLKL